MNQLEKAKKGEPTREMQFVANKEKVGLDSLINNMAKGRTVVLASELHKKLKPNFKPLGIGRDLRIKVNSNIGSSPTKASLNHELEKLRVSIENGADTVMDLSTGGDIDKIRREIIKNSSIPIGTVPIYQAVEDKGNLLDMTEKDFLDGIKKHINDGTDFITVHAGVKKEVIPLVKKRMMGVVSRGGALLIKWMIHNNQENPLYTNFGKILKMAKKYDVTMSLGDGLRPGCLRDATDDAQLHELRVLGELADRAYEEDVQVIIEGPGHIPLDQIEKNIMLQKEICKGRPFYVLGPIVTDIAPGYDHITSAIGGTLAAYYGADFLCYITPKEHLGLPDIEDVREGVITARIAAHSADIARGLKSARDWDDKMSSARADLNWKEMFRLAINPKRAKMFREQCAPKDQTCSMCDKFCSVKISKELRKQNES